MASELEAFLAEARTEAQQAPEPTPTEPPEPPPAAPEPEPAPAPPADSDDAEPPAALDGEAVIPRRAYEDERRKRQDWKAKASKYEGEIAELRRQLEARQAPPAPPAPAPAPVRMTPVAAINPVQDPAGFAEAQMRAQINHQLNVSEMLLRDKLGDEAVDGYISEFQELARADPLLSHKMYAERNPYGFVKREVDRVRREREMGDDPDAYIQRRIDAERERWEQERAAAAPPPAPPPAPIPALQPSLANTRSVAARSAPQWSGEPSLEDVLSPVQNRKRPANGHMVRF